MQRFTASLGFVCLASGFALLGCSSSDSNNNGGSGGATASGGASASQGGSGNAQGGSNTGSGGAASGGAASGGTANGGATSGGTASGGAASGGAASGGAASGGTSNGGSAGTAGASAGAAGASAGSGGGGSVELKLPIARNGKYVLEFGDILFEVDPAVGGRVVTFSLGGKNVLLLSSENTTADKNYGSIFWPSPQSAWGTSDWPPIPELDSGTFTASVDGNTIVMTQPAASVRSSLLLIKRYTPVLNAQAIDVEYTLTNKAATAASWAGWEISRVHQNGLTFWPTGTKVFDVPGNTPKLDKSKVTNQDGIAWYKNSTSDKEGKYNADCSEGWMAQASTELLFVKRFDDVPADKLAPSEGDCEFYAGASYVEIEPQGAYQSLATNASLTFKVRWYLRKLTDASLATVGNAQLVSMVRDIVKQ